MLPWFASIVSSGIHIEAYGKSDAVGDNVIVFFLNNVVAFPGFCLSPTCGSDNFNLMSLYGKGRYFG